MKKRTRQSQGTKKNKRDKNELARDLARADDDGFGVSK